MFAPLVAKAQAKAILGPASNMIAQRSTLAARSFCGDQEPKPPQRNGAPPGTTHSIAWDFSRIPIFPLSLSNRPVNIQTKLVIGAAADPLEQEADNVADQVMRMPAPGIVIARAQLGISRKCAACQEEETLQKTAAGTAETALGEAPGIVHEVLQSPGQALDKFSRAFFEPRFGQDFSHVRVHTDGKAARSAQAVNALAYTSGPDVIFGDGRYSPRSDEGSRLLAHELVHVVQQTTARWSPSHVQREPNKESKQSPQQKPKARQDIVLLGEGWKGGRELSIVLAHGGRVIQVNSVGDAAKALAKVDGPIGTLYFVTHSTSDGALKFGKDEGFIKAADIATKLKGSVSADKAPQTVDFRGCSVGNSPKAMENIRTALGAQSVVAGNCYAVIALTTPIKMGEKGHETDITDAVEVPKENRKIFEKLYRNTFDKFVAGFESRKGCIVTKSEREFFAAGGRFVALWFNSSFSGDWIKGKSVCYADAVHQTVDPAKPAAAIQDCSVITVSAPAPKATGNAPP
jgi:Domain of unknown function (DUF4157)